MVAYTVRISTEAGDSLREIYLYLRSRVSDEAADKTIDEILDTIDSFENFPGSHEREHYLNTSGDIEYRRTFSNNYRIAFAIDEEKEVVVDVLRPERSERTVIKWIKK